MRALGYYKGSLEGVWGPRAIAAKKEWEASGKFAPALPNYGMPLDPKGKLPKGLMRYPNGELRIVGQTDQQYQDLLTDQALYAGKQEKKQQTPQQVREPEQPQVSDDELPEAAKPTQPVRREPTEQERQRLRQKQKQKHRQQ